MIDRGHELGFKEVSLVSQARFQRGCPPSDYPSQLEQIPAIRSEGWDLRTRQGLGRIRQLGTWTTHQLKPLEFLPSATKVLIDFARGIIYITKQHMIHT
jgi:hypothetical protein